MKILVLNCGSSSIKYKLFEMESKKVMAQGGIEKIGLPDSFLLVKLPNGEKVKFEKSMPEHTVGIELILEKLVDPQIGCIKDLKEINAVGHRVVHGGEKFNKSVLITPEGEGIVATSNGVARSMYNLFKIFGTPESWEDSMSVIVRQVETAKGRRRIGTRWKTRSPSAICSANTVSSCGVRPTGEKRGAKNTGSG